MRIKLVFAALLVLFVSSCKTPKDVSYFQGIESLSKDDMDRMTQHYEARIHPDDLLSINVTSPDPSVATIFNPPVATYAGQGEQMATGEATQFTYLVDSEGYIIFPILGKIHVGGMTQQAMADTLQKKISAYISDPLVDIRFLNYKITVLGEVGRPSTIGVKNNRISILDAVGLAGDLTITANRKNIRVIRETNGEKEVGVLDFTSPDVFYSPYFYLQQNDVVIVDPNDAKKKNSRYSQAEQFSVSLGSAILSAVSVITSLVIALTR